MGGREETIIRAAAERGEPIPKEIQNRPEVWSVCEPYWNAFWALSGSRPIVSTGMGATFGHLTYVDKSAYAKDHGYADSEDELDDFLAIIDAMDGEYIKLNAPKKPASRSRA